jgi:hypothetical protein
LRLGRSTDDSKDYIGNFRDSVFNTTMDLVSWQNDIKLPVGEALLAAEYNRQKVSSTTDYTVTERTINSFACRLERKSRPAPAAVQSAP